MHPLQPLPFLSLHVSFYYLELWVYYFLVFLPSFTTYACLTNTLFSFTCSLNLIEVIQKAVFITEANVLFQGFLLSFSTMLHKFIPAVYFHCTQHCAVRVCHNFSIYSSILDIWMISIICLCVSNKRASYHNPIRPL